MNSTHTITRRAVLTTTMAGAVAAALAGCSVTGAAPVTGASGAAGGTINALFMKQAGYSESDVNAIIAAFQTKFPDIKVNPTFVAYEALHDKIVTSAPAGTYDVVLMDCIWPAEFASKGIVADLTPQIPPSWKTDMLGGALSAALYQDKYWGVPWGPSAKLFYFNTAMLAKVGASAADVDTWDGVLSVAKKLKDANVVKYPLSWSWSQAEAVICDYAVLLGAFGGTFTDASGKLAVNQPAGVQALTWMYKTITDGFTDPGSVTYLEDDTSKALAAGKAAMILNWESTFTDLNDKKISSIVGDAAVAGMPKGPSGANPGVNGSMAFAIPTTSKHQAAAFTFLQDITSLPVQVQYATKQAPDWKSAYTDPAVLKTNPKVLAAAGKTYDDLISRPEVANYNAVSQILQVQIQKALLGKVSPQAAMDAAVQQAAALPS